VTELNAQPTPVIHGTVPTALKYYAMLVIS